MSPSLTRVSRRGRTGFLSSLAFLSLALTVAAAPPGELDGASDPNPSLRDVLGLASSSADGASVGVALIDSGLSPSADFAGRIDAFYDFTTDGGPARPVDPYGHGTDVVRRARQAGRARAGTCHHLEW